MKKLNTVLFVGPVPPPVFGEAVAFKAAFEGYEGMKYLINKNNYTFGLLQKLTHYPKSLLLILYYLIFRQIDVVYFSIARGKWSCLRDVFLIQMAWVFKKKIVAHLHGGDFDKLLEKSPVLWRYLLRKSYEKVHTTAVILPPIAQQFEAFRPSMQTVVIPNFYDPIFDEVQPQPKAAYITLTFFSNLLMSKGIGVLLEAFQMLSVKYPTIRFQVAGHIMGDALASAEKVGKILQEHLQKNPQIQYVGGVFGQEKVAFLSKSDIFVLPSLLPEGQPISILEAMRAGNALVVSDAPFLPHCIEPNQGITVARNNAQSLADGLESLIANTQKLRQIQTENRAFAQEHFSSKAYHEAIACLLN